MALYTIIKLAFGIFPKKYIDKHSIKEKKLVLMQLSLEEVVQVLALAIAASCALFLLGNYGVRGDFQDNREEWIFFAVMMTGGASLLLTTVWKALVIRSEIKHDKEAKAYSTQSSQNTTDVNESDRTNSCEVADESEDRITELSRVWVCLGVVATSILSAMSILLASTSNSLYKTSTIALIPLSMALYAISFFAQPRRKHEKTIWLLRLHFASFAWVTGISFIIYELGEGQRDWALIHLFLIIFEAACFHYALKLRASIGRLSDRELHEILVESLFKGGFETLATVLFIQFRALKCVLEAEFTKCTINNDCATFISIFLLFRWGLNMVYGSVQVSSIECGEGKVFLVT